jgi:hypothetical protein
MKMGVEREGKDIGQQREKAARSKKWGLDVKKLAF